MLNVGLAQLPAQQHYFIFQLKREIQQPGIHIFYLDADRLDLCQRIFRPLNAMLPHCALPRRLPHIHQDPTRQLDPLVQRRQPCIGLFRFLLGRNRAAQQRLQHRQQRPRLFQRKYLQSFTRQLPSG